MSNLLRTPRERPASMLTSTVTPRFPRDDWTYDAHAARRDDAPRESVSHVRTQLGVHEQARGLRAPRRAIGMPLRRRRTIVEAPAASGGIASSLAGNR